MQTHLFSRRPIVLSMQDIDSLTKDSPIALLNALYQCQDFVFVDSTHNPSLSDSNITKTFGYKSSFYLSFISHKDSLSNEYLQARKALYKTMMNLREQREQEYKEEQDRISRLSYEEYAQEQREKERQARFSNRNTANKDSYLILESKDKSKRIIFLDKLDSNTSHISMSNLIHIHDSKIDIFIKDNTTLDIQELESLIANYKQRYLESNNIESSNQKSHIDCNQESKLTLGSLHSSNTQIFLYSQLLLGSKESPNNPLFFGELNKEGVFIESKPIYHLIGEIDSNSIESTSNNRDSNNSLSTLQVFLGSNTLTLLNYSLIDSSLNIKLECNSKESKAIQEREQIQREQIQRDSNPIDSLTSTAFLHPILEDNELKCPHNGVVKLKSNKGKSFKSKGIPMILESDLLNSSIVGCTNNIAGVPTPCMQVAVILPNARAFKKYNDDYPIMQDLVNGNVFSDKGFPLIATPKPNTFRINSPKPIDSNTQNKQKLESQINLYRPTLRLHYKITPLQKDNLPIYRLKLNDSIIESNNDTPLDSITIDIAKDTKDLHDIHNLDKALQDTLSILHSNLKQSFMKEYIYKYISLQLDSNMLLLILLIPQKIPKIYKELYKDYIYKDYGIGNYHYLYDYCTHIMLDIQDYTQVGLAHNPSNATILTLHTPYKAQRLELQLANGLDSILESKDREQNLDSLLTLKIINGGYKEKYWSFGEEVEEETEEKIDISQGILIASNDDTLAYELAFGERNDTIQIFNKKGIYLFGIERKGITETRLTVRQLYNKGIQWFESSAENYHKLLDVNPDLQDKTKCKGLGVLYFTWRDIVEFAEVDRFSSSFQSGGSGDWKQSPKGARGFILVSMEGIPYWADAVGQIPYAIGVYRNLLSYAGPKDAKRGVIDNKYYFYDGDPIKGKMRQIGILSIPKDELADNYDNKMVDRGLNFAIRKYKIKEKRVYPTHNDWIFIDLKPNPSLLALDSDGREVYAW